ncbi:uncharacterized protein BO66DRAFT_179090 [Aspergillus aculeatinus CBS 121060]|uniref:Uncharacterized protein n=1 Tax=Aspergillus aculeatinus CBS 121060 TaxID=1448322 RepID=A0ACD1HKA6_9EURO|nr:hypothetical protein BO66DRAFT_179090 [Aspergillus aculeatinus CBS 121060]RAH74058.1 hypothetical protein BO66DRAFT_179090 [Aspergillus aculeatinus CBS 121060]
MQEPKERRSRKGNRGTQGSFLLLLDPNLLPPTESLHQSINQSINQSTNKSSSRQADTPGHNYGLVVFRFHSSSLPFGPPFPRALSLSLSLSLLPFLLGLLVHWAALSALTGTVYSSFSSLPPTRGPPRPQRAGHSCWRSLLLF